MIYKTHAPDKIPGDMLKCLEGPTFPKKPNFVQKFRQIVQDPVHVDKAPPPPDMALKKVMRVSKFVNELRLKPLYYLFFAWNEYITRPKKLFEQKRIDLLRRAFGRWKESVKTPDEVSTRIDPRRGSILLLYRQAAAFQAARDTDYVPRPPRKPKQPFMPTQGRMTMLPPLP
jgi:hypothetical protein